ncbi:MAG TPA: phospholipase D-like domain-containing protein, partial [Acidimicrobiia bacterium]|nr:phospholipase D-like domain-containing protein [Acidimicrobiia bacterium]
MTNARDDADEVTHVRRVLEGVIGVPATEGNQIDVLRNGDEIFPAMLEAIRGAQHTIDLLTFVYWKGDVGTEFAQHLAKRAQDGVRVRLVLDSYGARSIDPELISMLDDAGVHVRWFRPLGRFRPGEVNHRTHRKVMVVDEEVAFTGGVGIADEWK